MNKHDCIASLQMKGLLLEGNAGTAAITESHLANDARYEYLKHILRNPKRVIVEDANTGEVVAYYSLYKAGRAIGVNSKNLLVNVDKIMDERFKITIPDIQVN